MSDEKRMRTEWEHLCGRTWVLHLEEDIPVWFCDDKNVVLLDTGLHREEERLLGLLREEGLSVRAVIVSHSHIDHSGNNAVLQKVYGAELILDEYEAAVVSDIRLLPSVYGPGSKELFDELLGHMVTKEVRTFPAGADTVEAAGAQFGIVPLPGHTPGHTGIVTPDDVLYVGDAVVGEKVLARSKIPSTVDWQSDIESKRSLLGKKHAAFVMAHGGPRKELDALIEYNIRDKTERAEQFAEWIREAGRPLALSEAEMLFWDRLGMRTRNRIKQLIYRRNLRCALDYLVQTGKISVTTVSGALQYSVPDGK